ncbi:MAG: hypothetical protein JXA71_20595 [Chitinispirillaceae bacterium]|nr:hypothetical protein [Chitinispirillaceae bacterium]
MTIITFLLIVSCCIAAAMLAVLLVPFTLVGELNVTSALRSHCFLHVRWLHPWLARWEYNAASKRSKLTLFGITRAEGGSAAGRETGESPMKKKDTSVPFVYSTDALIHSTARQKPQQQPGVSAGTYENRREAPSPGSPFAEKGFSGRLPRFWLKIKSVLSILEDIRNRRTAGKILRWCAKTIGLFSGMAHFRHLRIHAKAGTGDPAETGRIFGCWSALESGCFGMDRSIDVQFSPDFSGGTFECDGSIAVRISTARVLLTLLWPLLTFPYLRAYFLWRRIRKKTRPENPGERHACHA